MRKIHFLKYSIKLILIYNIFAVTILYFPNIKTKTIFWEFSPYQYSELLYFPNNLLISTSSKQARELSNIDLVRKNDNRNYLDIEYWNYIFFIENIDRKNRIELDKTFYKTLILSDNNPKKKLELKKYFFNNYSRFTKEYLSKIIKKLI